MVYPALLPLMRTPWLPVVDWTDAPADLNWLVRFAERRNVVSARVPSHFKRSYSCMLGAVDRGLIMYWPNAITWAPALQPVALKVLHFGMHVAHVSKSWAAAGITTLSSFWQLGACLPHTSIEINGDSRVSWVASLCSHWTALLCA
jgi:hypothetical protein